MGFDQRLSIVIQVLGLVKQLEIQGSGDAFILLKVRHAILQFVAERTKS